MGLVFLVLEFFVPSGGALAVLCALSLLAAIIVGFNAGPWTGLVILLTVCVVVPSATAAAVRWWPDTPFGKLILIQRPKSTGQTFHLTAGHGRELPIHRLLDDAARYASIKIPPRIPPPAIHRLNPCL